MRLRGATRRSLRESEASVNAPGEAASTEAMLSRLELQRLVAGLVRDLDEPYRTTLLLRFFEGRTSAEIAAGLGVPAGTVRWRLNEGLRRLRARLDEAHDGNRATWALLALPAAPPPRELASPSTSPAPPLAEIGPRKLAWISSGVLVPVLAGGLLLFERSPRPPIAAVEQPPVQQGLPPEESREMIQNKARMSTLFGVVVPALIASADAAAAPERYPHEKVTACVPADNAAGCIDRLARAQLPRAVETELKRVEAGRKLDKLRIEPRLRRAMRPSASSSKRTASTSSTTSGRMALSSKAKSNWRWQICPQSSLGPPKPRFRRAS
jgi:Sigma-70, region 4